MTPKFFVDLPVSKLHLEIVAALGCGLVAGVFFAFSTFVMPALARLQPPQGITAMQSINITAINPLFMLAIFGTAAACLFLAISALLNWQQPGAVYLLVGSLLYLIGAVLVTVFFNVPLNDALALVSDLPSALADPNSPNGTSLWSSYLTHWTNWNHLRTIAALAAAALLTLAIGD
jgi:uncharacterized membrane protein